MSPEIKTELQIPDLWYDFFARFLPGIVFVAAWRLVILRIPYYCVPTIGEIGLLLGLGYVLGLTIQPISSFAIRAIQDQVADRMTKDKAFVQKLINRLGSQKYESRILLKMHGEVAYFVQLFSFSIVLVVALLCEGRFTCWYVPAPFVFLFLAIATAVRRVRRAILLGTINPATT